MSMKSRNARALFLERGWFRFLLAFALVSLLHLPLYFLELPAQTRVPPADRRDFPPVVNLSLAAQSPAGDRTSTFLTELARWAVIADPRLSVLPNLRDGFSKHANPPADYPQPELPQWTLPFDFWPRHHAHSSEPEIRGVPLAEMIWQEWNRKTSIKLPPKQDIVLPGGDFWTLVGVGPLQAKPELRPSNWYEDPEYQSERPLLQRSTILEVGALPHPEPQWKSLAIRPVPRVLVRQSSGSRKLDALAMQAVHAFIKQQRRENPTAAERPEGGGSWLLKIDWRFPPLQSNTATGGENPAREQNN